MPRDIPLGNGRLLVAFDHDYAIRDLHYPNIGLENHLMGRRCRIGVRSAEGFSWAGSKGWEVRLGYEPDALVSDVRLEHEASGLEIASQKLCAPLWVEAQIRAAIGRPTITER